MRFRLPPGVPVVFPPAINLSSTALTRSVEVGAGQEHMPDIPVASELPFLGRGLKNLKNSLPTLENENKEKSYFHYIL